MAQTERSMTDVMTLLADNITKEISPQDLRDALASTMGYAGIVLSVPGSPEVATMVNVGTSYEIINIFDVVTAQSIDVNTGGCEVTLSPQHRITFNATGIYRVDFWCSFSSSNPNKLVTFRPHKNGSPGLIEADRDIGGGGDVGSLSFSGIIPYAAGDYIDVRVKIDSGTTNLDYRSCGLSALRVG